MKWEKLYNDHNRQELKDQEKTKNSLDLILTSWD